MPTPTSPMSSVNETRRQADGLELIASENFVSAAVLEAAGSVADQQVRRGLSRKALLRRVRVRGHSGVAGYFAGEDAVRCGARQRAAAFGCAGQHGGISDTAAAWRHRPRHEPRPRWPSHPRPSAELLGQAVHDRSLRRPRGRRADRLRRTGAAGAPAQAADDHGGRERLFLASSTSNASLRWPRRWARRWSSTWPTSRVSSPPACIPAPCPTPISSPRRPTRRCAGRVRGLILCRERLCAGISAAPSFPVCRAGRSCTSSRPKRSASGKRWSLPSPTTSVRLSPMRNGSPRPSVATASGWSAVAPTITSCSSMSSLKGLTGKVAEATLGKAGITVNKNAIPFDQNPPMVASGIRVGHAGGHDAWHARTRDGPDRRPDRVGRCQSPDDDRSLGVVRNEVERLCRKFPLYPERLA